MNHIPFTLLAYFFNALAVLANKFLLNKTIPDPLIYIFYISLVSLPAALAIPFTKNPTIETFILASISTLLWTTGAYFMFGALKKGQVSRVIPIIGTIVPLILLFSAAGAKAVSTQQFIAVLILITGMIFLTIVSLRGSFNIKELLFEILAAVFFSVSYLVLKEAFLRLDFFSVLVWSRLILLPFAASFLIIPGLRKKIINSHGLKINFLSSSGAIFIGGQLSGILGEVLLVFSISLTIPAFVNSLQGSQYIFLLFFAIILSKKYPAVFAENYNFPILLSKVMGIVLVGAGLFLMAS